MKKYILFAVTFLLVNNVYSNLSVKAVDKLIRKKNFHSLNNDFRIGETDYTCNFYFDDDLDVEIYSLLDSNLTGYIVIHDSINYYFDYFNEKLGLDGIRAVYQMNFNFEIEYVYHFNSSILIGKSHFKYNEDNRAIETFMLVGTPAVISLKDLSIGDLENGTNYYTLKRNRYFYPYFKSFRKEHVLTSDFWTRYLRS